MVEGEEGKKGSHELDRCEAEHPYRVDFRILAHKGQDLVQNFRHRVFVEKK
jgi:hypothetical protein